MNSHSATTKHDGDLLERSFRSSDTTRDMTEIMLALVVYALSTVGGKLPQYVKVYIREFQKPLSVHPATDQGRFGEARSEISNGFHKSVV